MNKNNNVFNRSMVAKGVALSLALASMPSLAASWEWGKVQFNFDSEFSLGTSIRMEDRDMSLIGNSNHLNLDWTGYNGTTNPVYSSADVWSLTNGSYSTNGDNGNLNFDKGEAFSTVLKGVHELDISYDNIGVFVRGMYFKDFAVSGQETAWANPLTGNKTNLCDDRRVEAELCSDIRFLDAFVYGDFELGNTPVTVRIGEQVISWGESTLISHGINTINPVDVTRARAPGMSLKEVFIPVGTIFTSIGLTENLDLEMYYQYEWEKSRLPQSGSYFASNDFAGAGGQANNIQLGFTGNPDMDLEFLLAQLNGIRGGLLAGGDAAALSQAYMAFPTKVAIRGYDEAADVAAREDGQYGIRVSYFAEELNETEFSAYMINYHSKRPLISGRASNFTTASVMADMGYMAANEITKDNVTELKAFTSGGFYFPEDIQLYGLSFNTNIGETAFAGEIAYRQDEPLQIDDVEILYAAMPEQLAQAGLRPDLANLSQISAINGTMTAPGGDINGIYYSDTVQAQMTVTHLFGPTLGTDNLVLLGEVGYVSIQDFPDELRLNGPGTGRSGPITGKEGLHVGLSNGPEVNPFPTEDAWGYRLLAKADFNNVVSGVNMSVRGVFSHDVEGITPDPMFLFVEDRQSASMTLSFDYLSRWGLDIGYNSYWGGVGTTNALSDRDFASVTIKYSL
jgi:hypothetical protein